MTRDEIASVKVREIVSKLKVSGYPAPVEIKTAKLNSKQRNIMETFADLAQKKQEEALEKRFRRASPGNGLWDFRMQVVRPLLQQAIENDMIHLGFIQRHARVYGAIPDHERPHNWKYFILPDNTSWLCWECGSEVRVVSRAQSVHFAEFSLAGGGEVRHTMVPYCPKCESEPSDRGIIRETVAESIEHDFY